MMALISTSTSPQDMTLVAGRSLLSWIQQKGCWEISKVSTWSSPVWQPLFHRPGNLYELTPTSKYINFYFVIFKDSIYYLAPIGSPGGSDGKESTCSSGDLGSIPESGRSPEEGNGKLLQCYCLENSMDRGAWQVESLGLQRIGHNWATNNTRALILTKGTMMALGTPRIDVILDSMSVQFSSVQSLSRVRLFAIPCP